MRLVLLFAAVWFIAATMLAAESPAVLVVPLKGEVSEAQFFFLRRALKVAEHDKTSAVILDMDTYGGSLDAADKIIDALSKTTVPTITYIDGKAASAGALIALATKKIYIAPTGAIGAAAPVTADGQNLSSTMNDKTVSYFSGRCRSLAERNGYNPEIAEAFISKEKEVKVGDEVVHTKGSLLTLSANEATRIINGKPVLAAGIADSVEDLIRQAGLSGEVRTIEPTGFERLAIWITVLAPLFLLGGVLGAYIEIKTPGFGIAGILSIVCFFVFFTGHYLAGLAGWEVFALFVLGLALVLGEVIIHPGTVIPGVLGVLLMLGALLWAMIDRYPNQPFVPTADMLWRPLINLGIAAILGTIAIAILARFLPRTPFYHWMVLGTANPQGPSFSATSVASPARVEVGAEGIATSILRPTGNAQFGDMLVDVVTRGDFVECNSRLRVIAVEGSRIIVERVG